MPIRVNAVVTAKARGNSDLMVLKVLTSLYTVIGLNFIMTPRQNVRSKYCSLANN